MADNGQATSDKRRFFIKDIWSSKLSLVGTILATVSAVLIVTAAFLDIVGIPSGQYRGLIAYGLLPLVFVCGLACIPCGIFFARRKARREGKPLHALTIDFSNRAHRRRIALILFLTLLNSIILSFALYEGYHYTDSNRFCGTLCHTVMQPQYTAYQKSAHARVPCVQCHIGSGATWYVKSKLSGLRQVWAVLTHTYHRPIPSPVQDLRPARETCEQCHWPQAFKGAKLKIFKRPGANASDDPLITVQALKIGGFNAQTGRYEGIHWHVSHDNKIEYLPAGNTRTAIKSIRVHRTGEPVAEYVSQSVATPAAGTPWRTMDCVDCHNQPAHVFASAAHAIDDAILAKKIDLQLTGIRALALNMLETTHTAPLTYAQISDRISAHYATAAPQILQTQRPAIDKAARAMAEIEAENVFPAMNIGFGTYRSHIGHQDEPYGCFRCHDEAHVNNAGKAVSQDCELCHHLLAEQEPLIKIAEQLRPFIQ